MQLLHNWVIKKQFMKINKSYIYGILLWLITLSSCHILQPTKNYSPLLSFLSTSTYDFGKLGNNEIVETKFEIINSGKKDLIIEKCLTSCGCVVAYAEDKTLKPNEKTNIFVKLKTLGRTGDLTKIITIRTNDPNKPDYCLSIKAFIM